ncbi:uncharacterized protein BO97DRAFT_403418 [Aspergillus homomorphus CBS 101889]|uniref:Uncharacterized protein n=1 Tax=Aspergillus homomorphus (strain CBS 101889) TaxID=1450537 RepID=A0A395I5C0_ASPHC|nr:hypothetical protein BO97DRAFT_403418 [Aspergillus homomorphus CBS 101889]RAL15422.1 hypothetical protein BO97DRAFT_403418 [Aspergillus homomorphus CBS 101889]
MTVRSTTRRSLGPSTNAQRVRPRARDGTYTRAKPTPHDQARGSQGNSIIPSVMGKRPFTAITIDDSEYETTPAPKRPQHPHPDGSRAAILVSAPDLEIQVAFTFSELCAAGKAPGDANDAQFDRFMARVCDSEEGLRETEISTGAAVMTRLGTGW